MTRSPHRYLFTVFILLLAVVLTAHPDALSAQSGAVQGRVKLEQARLAIEQEDFPKALTLFEEIISLLGPKGEYQYHAAWAAYETGQFRKAKQYIYAAIEGGDEDFELMPEYDEAFRLAAEIETKVSELDGREAAMEALAARSARFGALPIRDDLSAPGLASADRGENCEKRFRHGGFSIKADKTWDCTFPITWLGGVSYRVSVMMEEKAAHRGPSLGAGLLFGWSSWEDFSHFSIRIKPRADRFVQDVRLEEKRARCLSLRAYVRIKDPECHSGGSVPNGKGPFHLVLEVRPSLDGTTSVAASVDGGRPMGYTVPYWISGRLSLWVSSGEWVFRDLSIERLDDNVVENGPRGRVGGGAGAGRATAGTPPTTTQRPPTQDRPVEVVSFTLRRNLLVQVAALVAGFEVDTTVRPLDMDALDTIDSLLTMVAKLASDDPNTMRHLAYDYFQPAQKLTRAKVRPDIAVVWLDQAIRYDVAGQLGNHAYFFYGFAAAHHLSQINADVREAQALVEEDRSNASAVGRLCEVLEVYKNIATLGLERMQLGQSVAPQVAAQVVPGLRQHSDLADQYHALYCGSQ